MTKKESLHADFDAKGQFGTVLKTPGKWWDSKNPGFGMRVSPKLHRTWMYKGKSKGTGKHYEGSLPYAPDGDGKKTFTHKQALLRWGNIKEEIDLTDLEREESAERLAAKKRERRTLDDAFGEFIVERIVKGAKQPLKPATKKSYLDRYNRYLRNTTFDGKRIGTFVLAEINAAQWKKVVEAIAISNILRRNSKTKDTRIVLDPNAKLPDGVPMIDAHGMQVMALISSIYNYFYSLQEITVNPMPLVRLNTSLRPPPKRNTHIKHMDLVGFHENLKLRKQVKQSADATAVMFFAGLRDNAVRRLRWDRLDLDAGMYRVYRQDIGWKNFEGDMALSDYVLDLLRKIRSGERGYYHPEWIFPSRDRETHLHSVRGTVHICSEGLFRRASCHDLRKTFATAVRLVYPKDVIMVADLMGHKWATGENDKPLSEQSVTIGYVQVEPATRRHAANRVAEFMLEVCGARPMSSRTKGILEEHGLPVGHLRMADLPEEDDEEEV